MLPAAISAAVYRIMAGASGKPMELKQERIAPFFFFWIPDSVTPGVGQNTWFTAGIQVTEAIIFRLWHLKIPE